MMADVGGGGWIIQEECDVSGGQRSIDGLTTVSHHEGPAATEQ